MRRSFLIILIIFISITISGQNFDLKVDSLIQSEFKDPNGPGGVFLIARNGKSVYTKAFGMGNLELETKLNTNSVFQIGSMTKQFTASAILQLEEQGKLKTSDAISKYIPTYPNGDHITIHHLLTHTSGIKDFTKMKALTDIAQKEMTPEQMVYFFKNEPADFAPGEKFEYNNSGYVVLGHIIELASGRTYEEHIQKNIFDKAGMTNSTYASDRKIIKKRAFGYHQKSTGYVNRTVINFSVPFSSGSLMSTLDDMLQWQNALNQNLLLSSKSVAKAFTKYKLNNGEEIEYGCGWHLKTINGIPTREHGGSIFGFKSMAVYIPSEDVYVVGFSNCDCNSPTQLVKAIAKLTIEAKDYK